jgi:hypothetical protein
MSASTFQTLPPTPASHPTLGRRILGMSAVWATLGAVMGASLGLEGGGIIGAISTMIAGTAELAVLGAIFALIGGTPRESILGAVVGLPIGLTVGLVGEQRSVALVANFGLIFGAITGATLRPYLRLLSLPVVLLGRLLRRDRRLSALASRHVGRIEHRPFFTAFHRHAPESRSEGCGVRSRTDPSAVCGRK